MGVSDDRSPGTHKSVSIAVHPAGRRSSMHLTHAGLPITTIGGFFEINGKGQILTSH
jgi:hypothetical protein